MTHDSEASVAIPGQTPLDIWSAWLVNAAGIRGDWTRFLIERWAKDVRALSRMATCALPIDFAMIEADVAREMFSDYMNLARRLFGELDPELADSALAVA
jgi:hypothetical protein